MSASHEVEMEIDSIPVTVIFDHEHAEPSNGIGESYSLTEVILGAYDILPWLNQATLDVIDHELWKRRNA